MAAQQLRISGTKIVDGSGKEVILRGAGLGGWMNMENFITGYPGCEFQIRDALKEAIGEEKATLFFDRFLEHFFADDDARYFKSLGLNCIRIAINYRHFEDDMNPKVLQSDGFRHLDRVIDICAQHGIYTVIDMHTAPGGQNTAWHSDHGTHIASFWLHRDFQDRLNWLWSEIAAHYAGNPWIAAYNPLNEPTDSKHSRLVAFYERVYATIRAADPKTPIIFDGNTFASDFSQFGDAHTRWENTGYAIHDYSPFGFPGSEEYKGTEAQFIHLQRSYKKKREWMDERGLCVWNGEFGPVYARKQYEGEETDKINEVRYHVLKDQLDVYYKDRLSWSIWLYKDIGFQGMVHVSTETPYMQLFSEFLAKKHRLAVDTWGADETHIKPIYDPLLKLITDEVPEQFQTLYPAPVWKLNSRVGRLGRTILVAEFLVAEWASHFIGKSEEEIVDIANSFKFEHCVHRDGLNGILSEDAKRSVE